MSRLVLIASALLWTTAAFASQGVDAVLEDTAGSPAEIASRFGESGDPLKLEEVLGSTQRFHPMILAAAQERERARGVATAAAGAFDLRVGAGSKLQPQGFYENYTGDVTIDQRTTIWGTRLFGGYRIGRGDFPDYEGGRRTRGSGEFRGGLEVPLLRNGAIDSARAGVARAELENRAAVPFIEAQRIETVRLASQAYWKWVAAGRKVGVAARLLETARERQSQLEGRVRRGAVARVALTDNERLMVSREIKLMDAERAAEQAAVSLSIFLRDGEGAPIVVPAARLPSRFPAEARPSPDRLEDFVALGVERNPSLESLALTLAQLDVDLRLADNRLLPELDVGVELAQDIGTATSSRDKGPLDVKAFVGFSVPLQQREARGKRLQLRAKREQLAQKRRLLRDKTITEVEKAFVALRTAHDQLGRSRRNYELARKLRRAEVRKLELGTSDLINVNIREVQEADAAGTLIDTQASYFLALADFRAAVAAPADGKPESLPAAFRQPTG